jgi:iron(III) transport system substrate-binding protein
MLDHVQTTRPRPHGSPTGPRGPRWLAAPLLILLLGPACEGGPGCGTGDDRLVVYSGRTEALVAPVLAAFEEETGTQVRVRYADTSQLAAAVLEEGARTPADVFLAQDAGTLGLLEAEGRLRPLSEAILGRVDPRLRSPRGLWVGTSARARVLTYNPARVPEASLPKSLSDLTDPAWKGRVGWAPANASFQSFTAALIQLEGEASARTWLRAMKANDPKDYPSNTPLVQAVASGEIDVGLTNHYYLHRLKAEHGEGFSAANHYFDGGAASLVNVSAVGILDRSQRVTKAERFVEFLLSETAQRHFARTNHEIPVVAGVAPDPALPDLQSLSPPDLDLTALADLKAAVGLLRETRVLR